MPELRPGEVEVICPNCGTDWALPPEEALRPQFVCAECKTVFNPQQVMAKVKAINGAIKTGAVVYKAVVFVIVAMGVFLIAVSILNWAIPTSISNLFPTLFSKTFFILSAQLFITWLTTHFVFLFFKRIDPKLEEQNPYKDKPENEDILTRVAEDTDPQYRWVFSAPFFFFILILDFGLFLLLLFWGINQALSVSFSLFSVWSVLTGIELEYVLLNVEEGLGRKVLALTAVIVLSAALIGLYSHVDFGFLQLSLFIALSIIVLVSLFQLFVSMSEVAQRLWSGFGVVIFTLYLVFDFNRLLKMEKAGDNTWPDATRLAIKLYLDIINLILKLLSLLGKHHH